MWGWDRKLNKSEKEASGWRGEKTRSDRYIHTKQMHAHLTHATRILLTVKHNQEQIELYKKAKHHND